VIYFSRSRKWYLQIVASIIIIRIITSISIDCIVLKQLSSYTITVDLEPARNNYFYNFLAFALIFVVKIKGTN